MIFTIVDGGVLSPTCSSNVSIADCLVFIL